MGEAIETTQQLYPSLLERNPNLLFALKWVFKLYRCVFIDDTVPSETRQLLI